MVLLIRWGITFSQKRNLAFSLDSYWQVHGYSCTCTNSKLGGIAEEFCEPIQLCVNDSGPVWDSLFLSCFGRNPDSLERNYEENLL
jgi:hypothetical protein